MNWTAWNAAIAAEMAHGAMTTADPLTDSLYAQLEAPAAEGAQPTRTAGAGLTPQQRAALAQAEALPIYWPGLAAMAALAAAASYVWPWGVAQ